MNLKYRGISYGTEITSTLSEKTWIIAQFRGLVYRLSRPVLSHQSYSKPLKYRGIPYQAIQSTIIRIESKPTITTPSVLPQELPHN